MTGTDKKAKILKDDIANLVEFALNNGISEKRIVDLAEQAYDKYIERKKSSSTNIFYISIAVFVLIAAIAFSYNATWDLCHALIRIGLVKVFPVWNWTFLSESCLVKNPAFSSGEANITTLDCTVCMGLERIEKDVGVDVEKVDQAIFNDKVPLILPGTASLWKASQLFQLDFLTELFNSNKFLHTSPPCSMQVVIDGANFTGFNNVPSLLYKLQVHSLNKESNWFVNWANCNHKTNRILRKFYRKPSFIGPSIEMMPYHWLMLSSNHDHATFIEADIGSAVGWFAQLKGTSKVFLQYADCESACKDLYAVLQAGDIMVWPNDLMRFSYKAQLSTSPISVAALFGGSFD